ncbi:hypothetical protein AYO39_01570 [Actinobacteria bacterium SCGC AG-212-D09]|nr:hypothetical protein AYO39_01570 [Actinobacteria bacterium SCGC AG-212-D09]
MEGDGAVTPEDSARRRAEFERGRPLLPKALEPAGDLELFAYLNGWTVVAYGALLSDLTTSAARN